MVSTSRLRVSEASGEPASVPRFQFISIQGPDIPKDQTKKRLARSHAIKQGLKNKRQLQKNSGDNFRSMIPKARTDRSVKPKELVRALGSPKISIYAGVLDPFDTLAVDFSRLQVLFDNDKARQAPEPVFSVAKELAFQNFRSVFRTGAIDPALMNAIMLSLAFAVTEGRIDQECLGYQGRAINRIRKKMSSIDEATTEPTIGAILLLAGVEACLGMKIQVQLHMSAVQHLLEICRTKGMYLTCGIKRAIFWQDLNVSILSGSNRIVDHTTFAEIRWMRDSFSPNFFLLPKGFSIRSHLFCKDFITVLEDVHALKCVRDIPGTSKGDVMVMAHVNNHIASIQSRLAALSTPSPILECCRLAAYLCSIVLCCKIWCGLVIPAHISSKLLSELHASKDDPVWNYHPDLLLWILCIGGAFAPSVARRSNFSILLLSNQIPGFKELQISWPAVCRILKDFIWSEGAFRSQVQDFWEESFVSKGSSIDAA